MPVHPQAIEHFNRAADLIHRGQYAQAAEALEKAIARQPDYADAHYYLGLTLDQLGKPEAALPHFEKAARLAPNHAQAHYHLGRMLDHQDQYAPAERAYRAAVKIKPDYVDAWNNLAATLIDQDRMDEAIEVLSRASTIDPAHAGVILNLGVAYQKAHRLAESIAALERGIQLHPDNADLHWTYSLSLLLAGDLERGFREFEWRWKWKPFPSERRSFAQPQWDGSDIAGKTLFLHVEQGFGDAIQFVRYIPMVAERGIRVLLGCQAETAELFRTVEGLSGVVAPGEALPAFDFQLPLASLPLIFKTGLETVPATVPYLKVDPERALRWKSEVENAPSGFRVGLVWAGSPKLANERRRSMPLAALAPLATTGATFFSLQKGPQAAQLAAAPSELKLIDLGPKLADFAETAAVLANLDLVIAVDTAVAHLAGALGRPVWMLLPYSVDWRWMLDRTDSPWYPTMRIFRQQRPGDWPGVVGEVAKALSELIRQPK